MAWYANHDIKDDRPLILSSGGGKQYGGVTLLTGVLSLFQQVPPDLRPQPQKFLIGGYFRRTASPQPSPHTGVVPNQLRVGQ